jgi:hypothetical protein
MKKQLHMPKVLFICKKRHIHYGISVGLINSATFIANVLNIHGIQSKIAIVVDANSIDREVHNYKPTHVFIEALWVTPSKFDVLLARYPKVKWIVRIHSKAAFIAHEGIAMEWLREYAHKLMRKYKNFFISSNNKQFNQELSEVLDANCIYFPNIYKPINLINLPPKKENDGIVDIGCFGAIRPLKNNLEQAMSAIRFGNMHSLKIRFHVNAGRLEQQGENVLRNLRALFKYTSHELVEHDWLNHTEFLKLARQMDIGMQVSLSESFNIVAADMVIEDVPIVVSDEIDWVPWLFRASPIDGNDIVATLDMVYFWRHWGITKLNKWALRRSNYINTNVWLQYFTEYINRTKF